MSENSSTPDPLTLLSQMVQFHGKALEQLKHGPVDSDRARGELSSLHTAVGALASILIGGYEEPERLHERRLELTKIRAAHLYEEARSSDQAVISFATLGLKSLLVANGGALVAMLTFIGNFHSLPPAKWMLWLAFCLFVGGLFLSLTSVLFSYVAQSAVSSQHTSNADGMFFHEYRGQERLTESSFAEAERLRRPGAWLRNTAIATAVLSAIAFAVGSGFGIGAFASVS